MSTVHTPEDEYPWLVAHGSPGAVYLVATEDRWRFKIGYTGGTVAKRKRNLETGCGEPLDLLLAVAASRSEEAVWHGYFEQDRLLGEWFRWSRRVELFVPWIIDSFAARAAR